MIDEKPESQLGPVEVELAPGKTYLFDAMPLADSESLQLYIEFMARAEADDSIDNVRQLFPRLVGEVRKSLLERYSEDEVEQAMRLIRISERAGSPWSQIIRVLVGLA